MSHEETTPAAQKLEELAAPVRELGADEVEAVTGGMQLRSKRSEAPATDTTTDLSTEDPEEGYAFKRGFPIKWSG